MEFGKLESLVGDPCDKRGIKLFLDFFETPWSWASRAHDTRLLEPNRHTRIKTSTL